MTVNLQQKYQRDSCLTTVFGIIFSENKILLVNNKDNTGVERWSLPGGKVEIGETLLDALIREVMEETGCRIMAAKLAYLHESFFLRIPAHVRAFVFKAEIESCTDFKHVCVDDPSGTVIDNKLVAFNDLHKYIRNQKLLEPLQNWLNKQNITEYFLTKDMDW